VASGIKKLAGQTVIYGLGTIVPRLLNYMLTPILTRQFLPAEYGINSELLSYISFLNVIFTYGMETTFFNFNSRLDDKKSVYETALISVLCSSVIFSLLLFIFSPLIAGELSTPNAVYQVQVIIWSILIIATDAVMAIPFAKLRAENKALVFSALKLVNVVVNLALTIFFIVLCKSAYENNEQNFLAGLYSPTIGIGYCFLSMLMANVITLVFLSGKIITISWKLNTELLKEMLRYTWPLVILGLAGMVNETLDRIILKKLMIDKSEAQVAQGIYGACYKIAILMTIFIQAFRFAAEPFFFGKAKEKDSQRTYAVIMKYFVIFCLFLFLGTLMNLDWIKYLVAEEYWSGLKVVPILLIANLCLGVVYNLSIWYKLSGQTKYGATIAIVGALITIVINVVFVPSYSFVACAWATLAAYGSMMILSYVLGQKYYPIKYNLRAMSVYFIIALGFYFLSLTYSGFNSVLIKLFLNNLLVILFAWLVYKLEFSNLKKLREHAANTNSKSN
jgi:O-antigen/teichoic acid export membrane protein